MGPGGDDEGVIAYLGPVFQPHDTAGRVEVSHLAGQHAGVLLPLQHAAQRGGDVLRREAAGGDLVEQGLEKVEVAAVDEGDGRRRFAQRLGGVEAAEAAANNDHTWL